MASFSFSSFELGPKHSQQQPPPSPSSTYQHKPRDDDNNAACNQSNSMSVDLSNLFLSNNQNNNSLSERRRNSTETDASLKQSFSSYCEPMERRNEYRTQPTRRHPHGERSLYPNQEDLLATAFAECTVDDLFSSPVGNDKADPLCSSSSAHEPSLLRRNTSDSQLNQNFIPSSCKTTERAPGAFYSSASNLFMNHNSTNKPPKPSWVEKSTQVEQKIELQHRNTEPMMEGDGQDRPYRKFTSSCSDPVSLLPSPTKQPPRPDVEVSPGMYMPLRGTDETIQAIESGRGKLVFCLACSTALQCVPDCDLVICPDCRVFSPVPKFVDDAVDQEAYSAAAAAAGLEEDDVMMVLPPPDWIGGVGLGLKVSFLD